MLLALTVPLSAETTVDPLWYLLSTQLLARDERAIASPEETGADSQGLASLQADLLLLADGFESFRDEAQVKSTLARLEPRIAPELRPFFASRASSLSAIYRTLAVTDYTWARRFPEPPCAPIEARRRLLAARDGLFQNDKGEASAWLASLLGTGAAGRSAEEALDRASGRTRPSAADYERRRALVRKLTLALSSEKAEGAARAKLYCARASAFEDLAAFHESREEAVLASRSTAGTAPERSVFVVVWESRRAAATLLQTKDGQVLVTDASVVAGVEHPNLFAYSDTGKPIELTATVGRRDANLGLALLTVSEKFERPALALADDTPVKGELVSAIGHSQVSGLWTKTSGLVTKAGPGTFQTDAAVSADFSGGPVLNDAGEATGLLVRRPADTEEALWPVAVPSAEIARWLDGATTTATPVAETIEDAGTAAILTRAVPAPVETGLGDISVPGLPPPPPEPRSVCVSRCGSGSSPSRTNYTNPHTSYGGSSYSSNGSAELGQALGELGAQMILKGVPALFRGIGSLFKKKSAAPLPKPEMADNRHHPAVSQEPPPRPPDPLTPSGLTLTLSRASLAQGETVEAVAAIAFTGKDGTRGGRTVSFTAVPAGKLDCPAGRTDVGGIARVNCRAIYVEEERRFDGLQDEIRRRRGMKALMRVKRTPAKGDKIAELKERAEESQDRMAIEDEKQPPTGTDTPGLVKPIAPVEPEEYVIKGDRVTLGGRLDGHNDAATIVVLERPCPAGAGLESGEEGSYRCSSRKSEGTFRSDAAGDGDSDESEDTKPKPSVGSRPENTPTGTKPIDRAGLTSEQIHEIKRGLKAGAADWVGISPELHVITSEDGKAVDNGPIDGFTNK